MAAGSTLPGAAWCGIITFAQTARAERATVSRPRSSVEAAAASKRITFATTAGLGLCLARSMLRSGMWRAATGLLTLGTTTRTMAAFLRYRQLAAPQTLSQTSRCRNSARLRPRGVLFLHPQGQEHLLQA